MLCVVDDWVGSIIISVYDMVVLFDELVCCFFVLCYCLERLDLVQFFGLVVEFIVYYVDCGVLVVICDVLIEGGNWWGQVFEVAGFQDVYCVEFLFEGVYLVDVCYNMI